MSIPSDYRDVSFRALPLWEWELLFDFALSEITLGLTLVSAARAAYDHGQTQFGDDARARAEGILLKATALGKNLSGDAPARLSCHLDQLQTSINALSKPQ